VLQAKFQHRHHPTVSTSTLWERY